MNTEYVVANITDLPEGSHIVVNVAGREIGVFNVHGHYYAYPNACFHQNGPVCKGSVSGTLVASQETDWRKQWVHDGEILVCPWHSLEFNLTTGQCIAFPKRRLPTYQVKVNDGQIAIVLRPHETSQAAADE
jgi:nitrite reductase (NADH) small subunit